MALITYADKQAMGTQPSIPDVNKVTDSNMNEIKTGINNSTNFDTSEIVVGTYLGKPLYRKTINCGSLPNSANKDISHNIQNLGLTKSLCGMAVRTSDSRALTIPDSTPGAEISCGVTNTNVYVTTQNDRSSFNSSYLTIEYTKTTD